MHPKKKLLSIWIEYLSFKNVLSHLYFQNPNYQNCVCSFNKASLRHLFFQTHFWKNNHNSYVQKLAQTSIAYTKRLLTCSNNLFNKKIINYSIRYKKSWSNMYFCTETYTFVIHALKDRIEYVLRIILIMTDISK